MKWKTLLLGLTLTASFTCVPVFGQDEEPPHEAKLSFVERLYAQEEQERRDHEARLKNASDEEFRSILKQRMKSAFEKGGSSQTMKVVLDITNSFSSPATESLKTSLGLSSEYREAGIEKIEIMMRSRAKKTNPSNAQQAISYSGLKVTRNASNPEETRQFQIVIGQFNDMACDVLLSNQDVTDIYVTQSDENSSVSMEAFYRPRGRVLLPFEPKQYSDEFLNKGLYDELMEEFNTKEKAIVQISLRLKEGSGKPVVSIEEFLISWGGYDFEINNKGRSYANIVTTRDVANSMRDDDRVAFIRLGASESQIIETRP